MWGEPCALLMDDLLAAHEKLCARREQMRTDRPAQLTVLPDSFADGDHTRNCAMAANDWTPAIDQLRSALLEMLAPATELERFGYKEINVRGAETHAALRRLLPRADLLFLFRDPVRQWQSSKTMQQWTAFHDLDAFVEAVRRNAEAALATDGVFLEDQDVRVAERLDQLVDFLGLPPFDRSLVGDRVFASKNKQEVPDSERAVIERELRPLYEQLRARRDAFFVGGSGASARA